jgi:hypothetical protein
VYPTSELLYYGKKPAMGRPEPNETPLLFSLINAAAPI